MKNFEDDLVHMIENIRFHKVNDQFLSKLEYDRNLIDRNHHHLMAHLKGYLVHKCHQQENSVKVIEIVREEIQKNLHTLEYSKYMSLIMLCGCGECTDMAKFDDATICMKTIA